MSGLLIILTFVLCLLSVGLDFSKRINTKTKKQIFDVLLLLLLLLATMKGKQTSWDTENYCEYYENVATLGSFNYVWWDFEPGYAFLNSALKTMKCPVNVLFFLVAIAPLLVYRKMIFKYSSYMFLSLFTYVTCFFFLNEIIIIRFGIAVALTLYNVKNILEGKKKKALLCLLLAISFHYTALLGVLPWLLYNAKNQYVSIRNQFVIVVAFMLLFVIVSPLTIVQWLSNIVSGDLSYILERITRYKGMESAGIKRVLIYFPFFVLANLMFLYSYKKTGKSKDSSFEYIQALYFNLAFLFMVSCYEVGPLSRLSQVFMPILILSVGNFVKMHEKYKYINSLCLLYVVLFDTYIFFRQVFFNSGNSINLQ